MSLSIETLYYSLPVVLQNILVSSYGLKLYYERYNQNALKHLIKLKESELLDANGMRRLQEELFVPLARNAIKSVPYYQQWAKSEKIEASDIQGLPDLKYFPILEKQQIRENPKQFISVHHKKLIKLYTSGTSGTPITIFTDRDSRTLHYAFFF